MAVDKSLSLIRVQAERLTIFPCLFAIVVGVSRQSDNHKLPEATDKEASLGYAVELYFMLLIVRDAVLRFEARQEFPGRAKPVKQLRLARTHFEFEKTEHPPLLLASVNMVRS